MKTALVLGGGGFIGWHLVKRLKLENFWVRAVDIKNPEYEDSLADEFILADLRDINSVNQVIDRPFTYIFQLAADMGGAGYINDGNRDANVMTHSARINLNVADIAAKKGCKQIFFSSSACVYNEKNRDGDTSFKEEHAYPAQPENEYGWEKLFSERLYLAYNRYYGMNNKIARFHNIFGENGTFCGGKEKALAAICRKVALANDGDEIEIWGTGDQARSFLHVDDCVEGIMRLMASEFSGPINIGADFMISINELVDKICKISGKALLKKHVPGPRGVDKRNSDNSLLKEKLGWTPVQDLDKDIANTYNWICNELKNKPNL